MPPGGRSDLAAANPSRSLMAPQLGAASIKAFRPLPLCRKQQGDAILTPSDRKLNTPTSSSGDERVPAELRNPSGAAARSVALARDYDRGASRNDSSTATRRLHLLDDDLPDAGFLDEIVPSAEPKIDEAAAALRASDERV